MREIYNSEHYNNPRQESGCDQYATAVTIYALQYANVQNGDFGYWELRDGVLKLTIAVLKTLCTINCYSYEDLHIEDYVKFEMLVPLTSASEGALVVSLRSSARKYMREAHL